MVKQSLTRLAAQNLHPERTREVIKDAARSSLEGLAPTAAPRFSAGTMLRSRMGNADLAELVTAVRDVRRTGDTEVVVAGAGPLDGFRNFVGVLLITRGLAQEQ